MTGLYQGYDHSGHSVPEGFYLVRSCAGELGDRRAAAQAGECLSISRIRGCSNIPFKQGILASCRNSFLFVNNFCQKMPFNPSF